MGPSQSSGDRKRRVVTGWPCALCGTREPLYSLKLEKMSRRPPMRWKTGWRGGESRRQEEKAGVDTHSTAWGVSPGPLRPGPCVAWTGSLLGCQDGEGLVDLHHGDDEEAAGQQEGRPEEIEEEGLGPVEALVQDAGLIRPRCREAVENSELVEPVSDFLHVGPGRRVVA